MQHLRRAPKRSAHAAKWEAHALPRMTAHAPRVPTQRATRGATARGPPKGNAHATDGEEREGCHHLQLLQPCAAMDFSEGPTSPDALVTGRFTGKPMQLARTKWDAGAASRGAHSRDLAGAARLLTRGASERVRCCPDTAWPSQNSACSSAFLGHQPNGHVSGRKAGCKLQNEYKS